MRPVALDFYQASGPPCRTLEPQQASDEALRDSLKRFGYL